MIAAPTQSGDSQKTVMKEIEFTQDEKKYIIELSKNSNNGILTIKDLNSLDSYYKLEITLNDIQNKNQMFLIYKSLEEFINSLEGFIANKNISIKDNNYNLILEIFVFNFMNGNKEKVSFELNKVENTNKDEIIKSLCLKVNTLEEKYNKLNEKYTTLEKNYEKIMTFIEPMIKEAEDLKNSKFKFQWENHENCQLSNNNKILRKIKNTGWNTNVKGNRILSKNEINIFKIRVNEINSDKSGLAFGITRASSNFSYNDNWNMSCSNTSYHAFKSFKGESINKGDIITFIADLKSGSLEIKKNNDVLGKLHDIPKNEDLVPSVCNYYIGNEIEIIE